MFPTDSIEKFENEAHVICSMLHLWFLVHSNIITDIPWCTDATIPIP